MYHVLQTLSSSFWHAVIMSSLNALQKRRGIPKKDSAACCHTCLGIQRWIVMCMQVGLITAKYTRVIKIYFYKTVIHSLSKYCVPKVLAFFNPVIGIMIWTPTISQSFFSTVELKFTTIQHKLISSHLDQKGQQAYRGSNFYRSRRQSINTMPSSFCSQTV
jgi:hypothetical protein